MTNRARLATEAASLNSGPAWRIALYCVVVKLVGCCGVHTQTCWHGRRLTLLYTHTNRDTYHQKESVSGQPARPVDSAVLLLASSSPGHLTVQAFSCYWWLRTIGQQDKQCDQQHLPLHYHTVVFKMLREQRTDRDKSTHCTYVIGHMVYCKTGKGVFT